MDETQNSKQLFTGGDMLDTTARLYISLQNVLDLNSEEMSEDLVVQVGRANFYFKYGPNFQLSTRQDNMLLNSRPIYLTMPRSLQLAAIANTINRQMVYTWLCRLVRRAAVRETGEKEFLHELHDAVQLELEEALNGKEQAAEVVDSELAEPVATNNSSFESPDAVLPS